MAENKGRKHFVYLGFLITILLLTCFLGYFMMYEGHNWGGDFALYLHQTESLLTNSSDKLLASNTFSMENSTQMPGPSPQIGPYLYPWGLPLLLVPVYYLFGVNLMAFKLYMLSFFLLSLVIVDQLLKKRIKRKYSLLIVAILGVNPYFLEFLDTINSDIPYLFFALLGIFFIQKIKEQDFIAGKTFTYILTGFLIFIAYLVRTNGIVLLGTLLTSQLVLYRQEIAGNVKVFLRSRWIEGLPYISFFGFLILSKMALVEGSGSHLAFLSRVTPGKLAYNVMYYVELTADFYNGSLFPKLIFGFTLPFLFLGIYRRIIADNHYISYAVFTLAVFIIWPPIQGLRFIFSLLPFYLYFTYVGFIYAESLFHQDSLKKCGNSRLAYVFSIYIFLMFLFTSYQLASKNFNERQLIEGPYIKEGREMVHFISTNTDSSDVLLFFKPRVLNYLTNRTSVRVSNMDEIKSGKGEYFIYYKNSDFGQVDLDEFLRWYPDNLRPVFENSKFLIYPLANVRPGILRIRGSLRLK